LTAWPTRNLSEVAEAIDYGLTAAATTQRVGPKFLRITDIQGGSVNWATVPSCKADGRSLSSFRLKAGDIVFARTGATTGKSFLVRECPEEAVFASYLIRVRLNDSVEPRFVSHFFDTPDYWRQIAQNARGVAQPGVNATKLKGLVIPLPPLPEQRRIADVLDQADALRTKRHQTLAHLDDLGYSIFIEMFGDPLSNPGGWPDNLQLGDVAEILSGITKGRKLNGSPVRTVPYLAVVNVQDRALDLRQVKTIAATEAEIQRYRLQKDDLLLTEGGDPDKLGRGTLWSGEIDECIHQNHIFRVRLTDSRFLPIFVNWVVGSERGKRYFLRSAKQTTG
jgi:type I restriction enzyme, S subunit